MNPIKNRERKHPITNTEIIFFDNSLCSTLIIFHACTVNTKVTISKALSLECILINK